MLKGYQQMGGKMNKEIIRKLFFDMGFSSHFTQLYNFFVLVFLSMIVNIFIILKQAGEVFVSGFEICVWVFMIVWLTLRAMHSFNLLHGYFMLCGAIVLVSLFFMKHELIQISIIVCAIFYLIDLIYFRTDWRKRK